VETRRTGSSGKLVGGMAVEESIIYLLPHARRMVLGEKEVW